MLGVIRDLHPGGSTAADGTYHWVETSTLGSEAEMELSAHVKESTTGCRVVLTCSYSVVVPYFEWVFAGLVRSSVRQMLVHRASVAEARATGAEPPLEPKRLWWAPPDPMSSGQIRTIATLSVLLAVVEYGGSLLTQTVDYVANSYEASNAQLGVVTALTRIGALIALIGGILTDRIGRRRLLLWSLAVVAVATALTALAPNLLAFTSLQLIVRGTVNLAAVVAFIAAVEEAPEGSRTYTIAIVGIAGGLGYVLAASLLPVADIAPDAWRFLYGLGIVGLVFLPSISRSLTETRRFEALVARAAPRGRMREMVDRRYGNRFVLLCITGFLTYLFLAPQGQFTNRYLGDERDFSGADILLLRAVTQAVPALVAAYIGGRLAESSGRRPVARWGLALTAIAGAAYFSVGGPVLWVMLGMATAAESLAGPALSAFGTELFPTEVRGTAGGWLTIASVSGSAAGLLLVGYLADPLGSIGYAAAVTAAAPMLVALFFIHRLPEARGRLLDDVSPSEV
ncbi:MAG: MFS transporter [Actinomycetota bacterium]